MIKNYFNNIKEGYIIIADLGEEKDHKQGGIRPVLVISNNIGNRFSPLLKIIPFTTQKQNKNLPTHVKYKAGEGNLPEDSVLLAESTIDINKSQIKYIVGKFSEQQMDRAMVGMAMATPCMIRAFKNGVQNTDIFKKIAMAM